MASDDQNEPWKPGDEPTAERMTRWAQSLQSERLEASGDMNVTQGGHKPLLSRQRRLPIMAKLSGSSSPYSWTSQVDDGSGAMVDGPRTGTTNAYEVNNRASLNDKVVRLYPDGKGGYNFQAKKCCGGGGCTGVVTVSVGCATNGAALAGVTVQITDGSTTLTGTTNGSGLVNFTLTSAGAWTGTATRSGVTTVSFGFTFACANQTVAVSMNGLITVSGGIFGCSATALSGATVEIKRNGSTVASTTTNGSGNYTATVENPGGTWTVVVSATRFTTKTQSFSPPCNGSSSVTLTLLPGTGYQCDPCGGPMPISETLILTNSQGTVTLTYSGGVWTGTQTISIKAYAQCVFPCNPGVTSVTLTWQYGTASIMDATYYICLATAPSYGCGTPVGPVADTYAAANPTLVFTTTVGSGVCGSYSNFPFSVTGTGLEIKDTDLATIIFDPVITE